MYFFDELVTAIGTDLLIPALFALMATASIFLKRRLDAYRLKY